MKGPATILIVDDDVVLARAFALALVRAGYRAHAVHSAEEALRELNAAPPDAIVLDFRMPMINGVGFLYRLREQPIHRHIPVMVVTGESILPDDVREELRVLGAEILQKPLGVDQLLASARALLGQLPVAEARTHAP
ncbi:MAG TPA: response regulator [Vicinamibacterales bacterium]|nr:response regulator [Vicinamibacterales bacterium]